jgi:hypothetical protein
MSSSVKSVEPPKSRKKRLRWWILLPPVMLLCFLIASLPAQLNPAGLSGLLPKNLHPEGQANYSIDPETPGIPVVDVSVIREVILDDDPAATDVNARLATVETGLLTPVPWSTPSTNETIVVPTARKPTVPFTNTPVPTQAPTHLRSSEHGDVGKHSYPGANSNPHTDLLVLLPANHNAHTQADQDALPNPDIDCDAYSYVN